MGATLGRAFAGQLSLAKAIPAGEGGAQLAVTKAINKRCHTMPGSKKGIPKKGEMGIRGLMRHLR